MKRCSGFTLIELLVVIAIIAILAAILFPVFVRVKANAKSAQCLSNLKQLGMALISYAEDHHGTLPFAFDPNTMGMGPMDWSHAISPYVRKHASIGRSYFKCPSVPASRSAWSFTYAMSWNHSAQSDDPRAKKLAIVATNPWGKKAWLVCDSWPHMFIGTEGWNGTEPSKTVAFRHGGMCNFVFPDGHTRPYSVSQARKDLDGMW